jgi:hypothetical protein
MAVLKFFSIFSLDGRIFYTMGELVLFFIHCSHTQERICGTTKGGPPDDLRFGKNRFESGLVREVGILMDGSSFGSSRLSLIVDFCRDFYLLF